MHLSWPDYRLSPGGCDVPLVKFSGAVLSLPAAATASRPISRPVEEAPRPTPAPDEGPESFIPSTPQRQEKHH